MRSSMPMRERITVRIETLAGADGLDRGCITVEDDGKGLRSHRMVRRQAR